MSRRVLTLSVPQRGRILLSPRAADPPGRSACTYLSAVAVLLALPMFAQCFQYLIDILPLYLLSKGWPFLMLPLFAWALVYLDLPYKLLYVITLLWILGVTPFVGIVQLGNGVAAALATTGKVWSYSFMFSAAGMLVLLRPPLVVLRRQLLGLGVVTYLLMLLLWFSVPVRDYGGGDAVTKLLMYDPDRGYHIYMPMFFGVLLLFYLNRSFWSWPKVWKLAGIVIGFIMLVTIYKERAAIASIGLTMVIGAAFSLGRGRKTAFAVLGVAAFIGAWVLFQRLQEVSSDQGFSLGSSLSVRLVSAATAWQYLNADPLRWLVGVGATTRLGNVTLAQLFGNQGFFLADIGWLGVIFEYGVIGALLDAAGTFCRTAPCLSLGDAMAIR